jgi:hypothetical protein
VHTIEIANCSGTGARIRPAIETADQLHVQAETFMGLPVGAA